MCPLPHNSPPPHITPPSPKAPPPHHPIHPPPPPHHIRPPPHVLPPPPPSHHIPSPPPPHVLPPPPPTPGHHSTWRYAASLRRRKKKTVQKTEILEFDEHAKVQEAIVAGPHGEKITVLSIEEDVHLVEKIEKNEKLAEGSRIKSAHDRLLDSDKAASSSQSNQHHLEHKV
ncbi:hypothetical protein OIU84_029406 [Salix udensis]|uniref:Uncharacterized protein n=1 Tax=Salix udensis TaxID=889485 RepID=A0AAD6KBL1_9ROSI|nr:hypothetical protein OIU84_029406 [Salix udensis]